MPWLLPMRGSIAAFKWNVRLSDCPCQASHRTYAALAFRVPAGSFTRSPSSVSVMTI
jgi:hypothetical protein